MRLQRFSNGQWLTLPATAEIARAGEGCLYTVSQAPPVVAKIYHHPSQARAQKLHVMLTHPPIDPMRQQGHPTFAWPVDLPLSDRGHVVGFLMPWVAGTRLIDVYHPKTRLQSFPWVNPRFLLRTTRNLASMVEALHQRGYVVGDVNESNILVHTASQTSALVTLVDTDSLQVPDPRHGMVHRCIVGKPEFTPPELHGKRFEHIDRSPLHDRFGLAVLLFQLLMEGVHPFSGRWIASGEPLPLAERIKAGYFPHGAKRLLRLGVSSAHTGPPRCRTRRLPSWYNRTQCC